MATTTGQDREQTRGASASPATPSKGRTAGETKILTVSRTCGGRTPVDLRNEAFVEYADGTKIVRVMDDPKRSPEQSAQISVYRRERWIVLAEYAACSVSERADRETECARLRSRLGQLNLKLYQLTKNPIYDN